MYIRGVFLLFWKTFFEILVWGCLNVKKNKNGGVGVLRIVWQAHPETHKTAETSPAWTETTAKRQAKTKIKNICKIYAKRLTIKNISIKI